MQVVGFTHTTTLGLIEIRHWLGPASQWRHSLAQRRDLLRCRSRHRWICRRCAVRVVHRIACPRVLDGVARGRNRSRRRVGSTDAATLRTAVDRLCQCVTRTAPVRQEGGRSDGRPLRLLGFAACYDVSRRFRQRMLTWSPVVSATMLSMRWRTIPSPRPDASSAPATVHVSGSGSGWWGDRASDDFHLPPIGVGDVEIDDHVRAVAVFDDVGHQFADHECVVADDPAGLLEAQRLADELPCRAALTGTASNDWCSRSTALAFMSAGSDVVAHFGMIVIEARARVTPMSERRSLHITASLIPGCAVIEPRL